MHKKIIFAQFHSLFSTLPEEAARQVLGKENHVNVKNIFIEDTTEKCKVALWRGFANNDIMPGDFIEITDVVVNTFRNETSLTTTSRTKITVIITPLYLLQKLSVMS